MLSNMTYMEPGVWQAGGDYLAEEEEELFGLFRAFIICLLIAGVPDRHRHKRKYCERNCQFSQSVQVLFFSMCTVFLEYIVAAEYIESQETLVAFCSVLLFSTVAVRTFFVSLFWLFISVDKVQTIHSYCFECPSLEQSSWRYFIMLETFGCQLDRPIHLPFPRYRKTTCVSIWRSACHLLPTTVINMWWRHHHIPSDFNTNTCLYHHPRHIHISTGTYFAFIICLRTACAGARTLRY